MGQDSCFVSCPFQESFIHLVAQKDVMTSVTNPLLDIDINIRASVALFEAAIDSGVQSIVFGASLQGNRE